MYLEYFYKSINFILLLYKENSDYMVVSSSNI